MHIFCVLAYFKCIQPNCFFNNKFSFVVKSNNFFQVHPNDNIVWPPLSFREILV